VELGSVGARPGGFPEEQALGVGERWIAAVLAAQDFVKVPVNGRVVVYHQDAVIHWMRRVFVHRP
jgi:hypothetical protein